MKEQALREQIHQALDQGLSSLQVTPEKQQKILENITRLPSRPRKKISYAFILAAVLSLLAVGALAAAFLSAREILKEDAVPLALQNDEGVHVVDEYSHEQLEDLIALLAENGITLPADHEIMQKLRRGEGYFEESTFRAICEEAFGGPIGVWTIEQQHFYWDLMIEIGFIGEHAYCLPGEGEMTAEEARALAVQLVQAESEIPLPLSDPAAYRHTEKLTSYGGWHFSFIPLQLDAPGFYDVSFDVHGENPLVTSHPVLPDPYTFSDVLRAVSKISGNGGYTEWKQEGWHMFSQALLGITIPEDDPLLPSQQAMRESVYPLPSDTDLSAEEAYAIALKDAGAALAEMKSAVMLEDQGKRIWKITFQVPNSKPEPALSSWEIDSQTGSILRRIPWTEDTQDWARQVLHSTYEKETANLLTKQEAKTIAIEALWDELQDSSIPFGDETCFELKSRYHEFSNRYWLLFKTKTLLYSTASVDVMGDGTVTIKRCAPAAPTADTMFSRYTDLYGAPMDWEQERWNQLEKGMQGLPSGSFQGMLMQRTHYPLPDEVKLSKSGALAIAYDACAEWNYREDLSAILIDAFPHPVWKINMVCSSGEKQFDGLFEIDADTGNILDVEPYLRQKIEIYDEPVKLYILHSTYAEAAMEEYGPAFMAAVSVSKAYGDMYGEEPLLPLLDEALYQTEIKMPTVIFHSLDSSLPTYEVTFFSHGEKTEIRKIDSTNTPLQHENSPSAASNSNK